MNIAIMFLWGMFGPIIGSKTVQPLNSFKGVGLVLPQAHLIMAKSNDSTSYLTEITTDVYYNPDSHITIGIEAGGRFDYIYADTTFNHFYPNYIRFGAKFGFPLSKNADMGIAAFSTVPFSLLMNNDSIDIADEPLYTKSFPGLSVYHTLKINKIGVANTFEYSGSAFSSPSSNLSFESLLYYRLGGTRFFIAPEGMLYMHKLGERRPHTLNIKTGISFISDFNAAFTLSFVANILKEKDPTHSVFVPSFDAKYGVFMTIESWMVQTKYKRHFIAKKEQPHRFLLFKRFCSLKIHVKDEGHKTSLDSVIIVIKKHGKKIKNIVMSDSVSVDSIIRGEYTLSVSKTLYNAKIATLHLVNDTAITVYLKKKPLKDTGFLVIHVKDAKGNPIEKATVQIVGTGRKTVTDLSGTATLKAKSGSYLVKIYREGYLPINRYFVINKEKFSKNTVRLKRKKR